MKDFKERERHSTSDNHLVHFVQQILYQQYLVRDLCTAKQTHINSAAMTTECVVREIRLARSQGNHAMQRVFSYLNNFVICYRLF